MNNQKITVAITMGDPAGVGPAITAKALSRVKGLAEFVVIGDAWVFRKASKGSLQRVSFKFIDLKNVKHDKFRFGKVRAEYGRASLEYLDKAMELLKKKEIDCLVTCPISKEAVHKAGFKVSGHTEYLTKKAGSKHAVMMLLNRNLRFSLVTRHIPLARVPGALNRKSLEKTILITQEALRKDFSIKNPRIVVCGINPHASDNGVIGDEENRVIKPLLRKLKKRVRGLEGPFSADVAISRAYHKAYDAVIAIYHDQALIPLKLLGKNLGVNMTLGLGFVRTSPLHGTAFDIAGDFRKADPASLMEAIRLSVKCALNQKKD